MLKVDGVSADEVPAATIIGQLTSSSSSAFNRYGKIKVKSIAMSLAQLQSLNQIDSKFDKAFVYGAENVADLFLEASRTTINDNLLNGAVNLEFEECSASDYMAHLNTTGKDLALSKGNRKCVNLSK